jgi:DNA-binding transcriptional regulator GbsR (MarR family)
MSKVKLDQLKIDYISKWSIVGTAWGVNRTMGAIFALLSITDGELSTDEIMEMLKISRGNANTTLRELVSWGIVHKSVPLGTRKELFCAEKNQWKIACNVAEARRTKEIVPAIELLEETISELKSMNSKEARYMKSQLTAICKFMNLANNTLKLIGRSQESSVLKWVRKL